MRVVLVFSSVAAAGRLVAGLPAAGRGLYAVALAGAGHCLLAVPGGWVPDSRDAAELARLARDMPFTIVDTAALADHAQPALLLQGERPIDAGHLRSVLAGEVPAGAGMIAAPPRDWRQLPRLAPHEAAAMLDRTGAAIVAATAKPGDGIVSRLINRPISQAMSRLLLRFPAVRPAHATVAAAVLAAAMIVALVCGGVPGLIAGAVFYQSASIVDGVDGEIARATFRSSAAGAMADSLVDAVTNIGFLAGIVINLWIRGDTWPASAGAGGLASVTLGLFLIGRRARQSGGAFTFDGVKNRFKARRSRFFQILIWMTMRDFFALAWLVVILAGGARGGIVLFSAGAAVWLLVVLFSLSRNRLDLVQTSCI
ncbi:MAG: hypothetical protein LBV50_06150 [Novosphingobium sp.]|jgi:CDP-L-myo-inositol myo-inositolphosphotransferase|nr:hypothetical protein [Novosphingobium sp.]